MLSTSSDARRTRTRWRVLGTMLATAGGLGAFTGEGFERYAADTYGTGVSDAAIEGRARLLDGEIMTSDPWEDGWLVSYEYYFEEVLEVGYQRIPTEEGQRLAFGSRVRIEAIPAPRPTADEGVAYQGRSRLLGTLREPRAWITQTVRATRWPRRTLSLLLALIGLGLWIRPPRLAGTPSTSPDRP